MSAKLKWFVGLVMTAGLVTLARLLPHLDLDRVRQVPTATALFAVLAIACEVRPIPIHRRGQVRELTVTLAVAWALVLLVGTAAAVAVYVVASLASDLSRRKGLVKLAFNASVAVLTLSAGGVVYSALGGGHEVRTGTLPAVAAGAAVFWLLNHLLVSTVLALAEDVPARLVLARDLRLELQSSAMLLALAPVAVIVAERSLLLVPVFVVPLAAVYLASRSEVEANQRRAEAEAAAALQRRLTEQEQEVVRRLQEADRMKADLIATVTHELRSPLTTILGVFGLLHTRSRRLGATDHEDLVVMGMRQSERLRRMIEQLLVAARFEEAQRGDAPAQARTELDATELVLQAGDEARARHLDRPIAIETDGSLPVRVVQDAVVHVLGNLIDNAAKYSPEGEPIRLSGSRDGTTAVLAVEDSGPGIPLADRQRIFERFTQLDWQGGRHGGGVGLGLYIARQLARSQDGELVVTDASGAGGARFELHLPLRGAANP
jgi:signal transduction histidine kinase